nr:MAG TPA: hypothetical protein [Caudoviricetes sp.]
MILRASYRVIPCCCARSAIARSRARRRFLRRFSRIT